MYIKVRAITKAKEEKVEETSPDHLVVSVREKPENNAANRRILELVAQHFTIPVAKVKILSGHHSPSKMLVVDVGA